MFLEVNSSFFRSDPTTGFFFCCWRLNLTFSWKIVEHLKLFENWLASVMQLTVPCWHTLRKLKIIHCMWSKNHQPAGQSLWGGKEMKNRWHSELSSLMHMFLFLPPDFFCSNIYWMPCKPESWAAWPATTVIKCTLWSGKRKNLTGNPKTTTRGRVLGYGLPYKCIYLTSRVLFMWIKAFINFLMFSLQQPPLCILVGF